MSEYWSDGDLPPNAAVGANSLITGKFAFQRFLTRCDPGLVIGSFSVLDRVQFAAGLDGVIEIGSHCRLCNTILLAEASVKIGNYVMIGFNTTIADTDFHPLDPAARIQDAIACSPLSEGRSRPRIESLPVVIEDDVYIGPSVAILKGVTIGRGAFIEPGSVITRSIPAGARVLGNPARIVGEM